MEGPLEVKHSIAGTEERIKSETSIQNSDSSERNDGVASPPPNCSICLGKLVNKSFTDSCLHQFCFTCLLKWSKIKTECPLCKQTFKSIIHNVRSEEDYDQYHVPPELAQIPQPHGMATLDDLDVGRWDDVPRLIYRAMTGHHRHHHGTLLNPEQVARREQLPSLAPQVTREELRRRRENPLEYRRTVYRHGMWAVPLPDIFGRFRECSAEYYRRHPRELERLVPWLTRELQVLLDFSTLVTCVLNIIKNVLTQCDIRSSEFHSVMRPHFNIHTDHFIHELLNFAQSNFDVIGYDQTVAYLPCGLANELAPRPYVPPTSPTSSSISSNSNTSLATDNSDIRILDEAIDLRVNNLMPNVLPFPASQPGPSTVGQLLRSLDPSYEVPELLVLSSNSSDTDGDCEIIGYVKPRHERTPEVIELLSSDTEQAAPPVPSNENAPSTSEEQFSENFSLPSTSYATVERLLDSSSSSTTSVGDNSDSDYNPRQNKRSNHSKKASGRKLFGRVHKKSTKSRSHNKRSRNSYSSEESDFKKRGSAKVAKTRKYTSSDSSSSENSLAKCDEKRSTKERYSAKERMKFTDKEGGTYPNVHSFDDDSSSTETKCVKRYILKRKRSFSSSDYTVKSGRITRKENKERTSTQGKPTSNSKDRKRSENRQSRSRSTSLSSNVSEESKALNYSYYESRDTGEYRSQDDSASMSKVTQTRRQPESRSKSKLCYSSDSGDDRLRSSSQCSNRSNKSYPYWRRSKHKDRYKDKDRNRYSSRICSLSRTGLSLTIMSTKNDVYPTKHSDCVESHKSSRSAYKESKHRKSQSEKKLRSKKRRRRLRTLSTSESE
ncbi:PREDICTED: E3 ubiquitin-protein ligase Topors-like isoform X2 [Dinoponera quadriceps]|uniref:E3 ubiquitin-protein ligase Topors n=1 Tax=Dinoponera quadriceps TaxID=609295 RepID=A0A6P3X413_DINQU|nr:PREDICTED: E3 ubiquitin-protein ligase Topors-like isoform X2 [Dinoponera quadriceps]